MFFGDGRTAFLEFLRNLTPQILFLTLAIVLSAGLDLSHFEITIQGFKNAAPYVICLGFFYGSVTANCTKFLDASIAASGAMKIQVGRVQARGLGPLRTTVALVRASWQYEKAMILKVVLVAVVAEAGVVTVFFAARQGAISSLKAMYS